ncbi:MAG TPA: hypothetical protein VFZ16_12345 [Hyphomicrobiaceae bacterium]|nr:hypothetical protein [Hyphomicrobiaceae bacterium]
MAALKGEIEKIVSNGPVGLWSNVPATFPYNNETVVFHENGSGMITSWSALSGRSLQTFTWSMAGRGRITMRYCLTRFGEQADDELGEPDDTAELSPVTFGIEIVVQETEIGAWAVLVSEGSDAFDCLRTGLARIEPPLRLDEVSPGAALPPQRSFFSRVRSLVSWSRPAP